MSKHFADSPESVAEIFSKEGDSLKKHGFIDPTISERDEQSQTGGGVVVDAYFSGTDPATGTPLSEQLVGAIQPHAMAQLRKEIDDLTATRIEARGGNNG